MTKLQFNLPPRCLKCKSQLTSLLVVTGVWNGDGPEHSTFSHSFSAFSLLLRNFYYRLADLCSQNEFSGEKLCALIFIVYICVCPRASVFIKRKILFLKSAGPVFFWFNKSSLWKFLGLFAS